jgi:tetratricopeptide (TPR) repeat protein
LESLGRYKEASEGYSLCASQAEKAGIPPGHVFCLLGLASVSYEQGDLVSADKYLAAAGAIVGATLPADFPATPRLKTLRGSIALAEGHRDEARTNLDAVIAGSKSEFVTTNALRVRAELNLEENKNAAAEADARRALTLAQGAQGGEPYSNRTGLAFLTLGNVLAKEGNTAAAAKAFRRAVENLSHTVDADHPKLLRARQLAGIDHVTSTDPSTATTDKKSTAQ